MSTESLINCLQAYRQHARDNTLRNIPGRTKRKVYPPEVMDKRNEILSSLCIKHKAKIEANKFYYGVLVATATRMALEQLGLSDATRKGFHTIRIMNRIRVNLGIRDKRED